MGSKSASESRSRLRITAGLSCHTKGDSRRDAGGAVGTAAFRVTSVAHFLWKGMAINQAAVSILRRARESAMQKHDRQYKQAGKRQRMLAEGIK